MRRGLKISLAMHTAIIALIVFGLPHFGRTVLELPPPIAVEIVNFSDISAAPPKAQTVKKQAEQKKPDVKPPEPLVKPPEPPKPEDMPLPEPEPKKPDEKKPEPKKEEPKKEPPKPQPPKPKPEPKKPVKPEPKKVEKKDDKQFSNLLAGLTDEEEQAGSTEAIAQKDSPVDDPQNISAVLSASELDRLRAQIMACWVEPTGLREGEQMVVEVRVAVNQDRTVQKAEVLDTGRMRADPFYRTLGESAVRALYNPNCSPLLLPESKYSSWGSIVFRFSPRGLF
jgi:outer membrane biosynthesis protein TonB